MTLNPTPPAAPHASVPLAWVLVVGLVAAAVGVGATAAYFDLRPSSTAGDVTVVDDADRTVSVPLDPSRVAVLAPSIVDPLYRLGLRSHIVAVGCADQTLAGLEEDFSPDQVALWNLTASMCVADYPISTEELLTFNPQLVLAATIDDLADLETFSTTYHIPLLVLQAPSLSGILVDDSILGTVFGVTAKANTLNGELTAELNAAINVSNDVLDANTSFPSVLLTYGLSDSSDGYYSFGPGTFGESLLEFASGASISANSSFEYPVLSAEQVLEDNPQVIIYGTGFGYNLSYYEGGEFWSDFSAVENHQAFGLDSNLITEADPTMILEGLPAILAILYPTPP